MNPLSWIGWGRPKLSGRDSAETMAAYQEKRRSTPSVENILSLSTAWACIRLLSETVGTLPLPVYKRAAARGDKEVAFDHPLYALLHDSPNARQTAAEFWEGQVACLCGWGNGYSEKKMIGDRLVALEPLNPDTLPARRTDGSFVYRISDRGRTEELPESKVFHIRGFGFGRDGVGLSPIRYGAMNMRGALAAEEAALQFLEGGLQVAGFVKEALGTKATHEQRKDLMSLMRDFMGSQASGKVMPLPAGFEFEQLTMNPNDAQLLQSRAFNVEEVCRWFRVPPFMVGHTEKSTSWGTGLEQQMIGFLTFGLRPYLTRIEQSISKQLIAPAERGSVHAEFVVEGLLRADSQGRAALYSTFAQNGIMTRDEIRSKENLAKRGGGAEQLTVQSNLLPIDMLGKQPAKAVQPAPGEPIP